MEALTEFQTDTEYWDDVASKCVDFQGHKMSENFGKKRQIIRKLLEFGFGEQKILEVGVGNGLIGYHISRLNSGCVYKGIDVSPLFAKAARKYYHLDVQEGRITNIPFPDDSFTVLFLFDVMEHIHPEEREVAYAELRRVLNNPNSMVFINNPLTESQHDENYDFYFTDQDVARMAEVLHMRISKVEVISSQSYYYQFIQLIPIFLK